jgi:hypothetical protein
MRAPVDERIAAANAAAEEAWERYDAALLAARLAEDAYWAARAAAAATAREEGARGSR